MSSYLEHLPPVFREGTFATELLAILEAELFDDLAVRIELLPDYLTPGTVPRDRPDRIGFLDWLARLVALEVRPDWDEETRRWLLAHAVPLYRQRGTRAGLQRMLLIHLATGNLPQPELELQRDGVALFKYVPEASVRIADTAEELGFEPEPHYFQVTVHSRSSNPEQLARDQRIAELVIDLEKPVHAVYGLRITSPDIMLGVRNIPDVVDSRPWILGVEHSVL